MAVKTFISVKLCSFIYWSGCHFQVDVGSKHVYSAQKASSHVTAVTQSVLNQFHVLQVFFDDTDQVT